MEETLSFIMEQLSKTNIKEVERATSIPADRIYKWIKGKGSPKSGDERTLLDYFKFGTNSDKNGPQIITPDTSLITKTNTIVTRSKSLIPFYNADFMAGKSDVFYEDGSEHPDYYMDVPEFYGCIAFRSFGDSMDPIIKSGCVLFGSKMDDDWRVSLEYGQIYGITMLNGRRYLKYVRKSKDHKNMFLLKSANKEYDDFEIFKDKIKNLWLIQGWIDKRA